VTSANKQVSVVISRDGPYIVSGDAPLTEEIIGANAEGESMQWQRGKAYDAPEKYALCRCGQSAKARGSVSTEPKRRRARPMRSKHRSLTARTCRLWMRGICALMQDSATPMVRSGLRSPAPTIPRCARCF
jgi:hypothetical protein